MRGNTRGENRSWSGMPAPQIISRTATLLRQEGQLVTAVLDALSALHRKIRSISSYAKPEFHHFL